MKRQQRTLVIVWIIGGVLMVSAAVLGGIAVRAQDIVTPTPTQSGTSLPITPMTPTPQTPTLTPSAGPSPTATETNTATLTPSSTLYLTNTPTPMRSGAKFIADAYAAVLFPAGLHFEVVLNIGLDHLKDASLHLWQPDNPSFDVTVPAFLPKENDAITKTISRFSYNWAFDEKTAPRLFQKVNYEWTVTSTDSTSSGLTGSLTFEDTRPNVDPQQGYLQPNFQQWKTLTDASGSLQLLTHSRDLSLGAIAPVISRIYQTISGDTGYSRPYRFVIYDPDADFCERVQTAGQPDTFVMPAPLGAPLACDPAVGPRLYALQGYTYVRRASLALNDLEDQLAGIVFDDAYGALWNNIQPPPPLWFQQGLRQLYSVTSHGTQLTLVRNASRSNTLLSLDRLNQAPPTDVQPLRQWNAQSYLLVLYMVSAYGPSAPSTLALSMNMDGYSFEQALQILYKTTPDQLYANWQSWLNAPAAAIQYSPYAAPTTTPTQTPTDLPTFTDQPTITPIPSETDVPFYTFTPILTNTPLPPGTLVRPKR